MNKNTVGNSKAADAAVISDIADRRGLAWVIYETAMQALRNAKAAEGGEKPIAGAEWRKLAGRLTVEALHLEDWLSE